MSLDIPDLPILSKILILPPPPPSSPPPPPPPPTPNRRKPSPLTLLPPELALQILHSLPTPTSLLHLLLASPTIRAVHALNYTRIFVSVAHNHEILLTRTALADLAARGIPLLELPFESLGYVELWGPWGETVDTSIVVSEVFEQAYGCEMKGGGVLLSAEQRGRLKDVLAMTAWTIEAEGRGAEQKQKLGQRLRFEQKPRYEECVTKGRRFGYALHFLKGGNGRNGKRKFDQRVAEWYVAREAEWLRRGWGVRDVLRLADRVGTVLMNVGLLVYMLWWTFGTLMVVLWGMLAFDC